MREKNIQICVKRGGSWNNNQIRLQSAIRYWIDPDNRNGSSVGFRCVATDNDVVEPQGNRVLRCSCWNLSIRSKQSTYRNRYNFIKQLWKDGIFCHVGFYCTVPTEKGSKEGK